jgi:cell division septation protein DedD
MSTSAPTLAQTLINAIPAEDGATLVAQVGECARIASSAGSVDVGSVALTAAAVDDLSAQLLAPEQLQMLRDTGAIQVEFAAPGGAGNFVVLATLADGDRRLEVCRKSRSTAADASRVASPEPPSEETLFAELLSRSRSKKPAPPASTTAAAPSRTPVAPEVAKASPPPEMPTAPPPIVAAPEPVDPPLSSNADLDVPTNIEFSDSKFDLDDLAVPEGILNEAAPMPSRVEPAPQAAKRPNVVMPHAAARTTISDRLRSYGRLSILLPALACLVIGLPAVGWFTWKSYLPSAQVASVPTPPPLLRSKPVVAATLLPGTTSAPVATSAPSAAPTVAPQASAPAPSKEPTAHVPSTSTASAPPHTGFSVQVAAMRARDEAEQMAASLVKKGYSAYVVSGDGAAAEFFRVRIGGFQDRPAAEDVARKIELSEGTRPWIVKETR